VAAFTVTIVPVNTTVPLASGRVIVLFVVVGVQVNVPVVPALCITTWFDVPDKFRDGIVKAEPTVLPMKGTPLLFVTKIPLLADANPVTVLVAEE